MKLISPKVLRRIGQITILLLLSVITLWVAIAISIVTLPQDNYQGKYDCAIVLEAGVNFDEPTPVFQARLDHGIDLYNQQTVDYLIFTGGLGASDRLAEGEVGAIYAFKQGVPRQHILAEKVSETTLQNFQEVQKLMNNQGLSSAIIVSDPLHLRRSLMLSNSIGLKAGSSATPYTRYRSWKTKLPFLLREIHLIIHFNFSQR